MATVTELPAIGPDSAGFMMLGRADNIWRIWGDWGELGCHVLGTP